MLFSLKSEDDFDYKYSPQPVKTQNITITSNDCEMTTYQCFELFKKFMLACGYAEYSILDGACQLAFNEGNDENMMKKLMEEYELQDKVSEYAQQEEIQRKALELLKDPDALTLAKLQNAEVVCKDCGEEYGDYTVGCSSTWEGTCNVCGETKPVTEIRDWGYLAAGILRLKK